VTGFNCANCGMQYDRDGSGLMTFRSEPVIISVKENSALRAGDVLVSVAGKPITTNDGADRFVRPGSASIGVRVRRDGKEIDVPVQVSDPCRLTVWLGRRPDSVLKSSWLRFDSLTVRKDQILLLRFDSVALRRDSVRLRRNEGFSHRVPFGFAVGCQPSCTRTGAGTNGYWKYDAPPPVASVVKGSPADRAGLRMGDTVLAVDGESILEEKGARALTRAGERDELRVTVMREGKRIDLVLRSR
jgi:C-terminal processing protease CtpA/Prc